MSRDSVLIIGAGLAGMKAGLLLANAGKKVYLVEKLSLIGGMAIKDEEFISPTRVEPLLPPII